MAVNTKKIETASLTAITVALAALCNAGVKLGHFGTTDFLAIGEEIAGSLLQQVVAEPEATAEPVQEATTLKVSQPATTTVGN